MMRTNFLKRLESSAHSLTLTLDRTIGKIDGLLNQIERYETNALSGNGEVAVQPEADEDDEEFFVNRARHPYHLRELDLSRWQEDLRRDRATLRAAHGKLAAITPARDGKLHDIRQTVRRKAAHPTRDQDGRPNRKLLVFTTFKDTAHYLYDNLSGLAEELGLHLAMVSGDDTRTTCGPNHFNAILTNFAPRARGRTDADTGDIDLLIATDCISEGQNLQDCDTVLNYDIHWNPVRLIQRFGRIDRMGSRSRAVRMLNYWPTRDMDAYLRLKSRVQARMALADVAASGDEDPFSEADAQLDLDFRDRQLLRLRDEVLDLDGLDDTPAMSDFTLDYFFAQLLRYLEKNRQELEATPLGAYAVTRPADGPAGPGVIFFLRQSERQRSAQTGAAHRQPHSPVPCRAHRLRWLRPLRLYQRPAGAGGVRGGNRRQNRRPPQPVRPLQRGNRQRAQHGALRCPAGRSPQARQPSEPQRPGRRPGARRQPRFHPAHRRGIPRRVGL